MTAPTISIDGRLVGPGASLPVLDHGLLYGDGVFEGMRMTGRRLFRVEDHLRRLRVGMACLGLSVPGGIDAIREALVATCRAAGPDDAYVRLVVTRGEGPLGVDPTGCTAPRVICIVATLAMFPEAKAREGLDLVTSSWRRPRADVLDPRVKSLNYLNNVLAKREARMRGADDALLLNDQGRVAEASGANVFVVRDGRLLTPPPVDGALEGITRRTVLELAGALGVDAVEHPIGRVDLLGADEVFLTGTGAGIVPIRSLDGAPVGGPGRPLTDRFQQAYATAKREWGSPT